MLNFSSAVVASAGLLPCVFCLASLWCWIAPCTLLLFAYLPFLLYLPSILYPLHRLVALHSSPILFPCVGLLCMTCYVHPYLPTLGGCVSCLSQPPSTYIL